MPRSLLLLLSVFLGGCTPKSPRYRAQLPSGGGWATHTISAHGLLWDVRESEVLLGAGPNYWSSAKESVFVDSAGRLHLRLRTSGGRWLSSEVSTSLPCCYSRVTAQIEGPIGLLDPRVVAAVFLYRSDTSEIDVEFAKWGQLGGPNAQFVVAPAVPATRIRTLKVAPATRRVVVTINWEPESIDFSITPDSLAPMTWRYLGTERPTPNEHRLHINLWLFGGTPSADLSDVELTISSVEIESQNCPQDAPGGK
ncbi:MAG: hypothetical protein JKY56_17790 [Kofleriaceae bacterium]|nr:hypothetical protein [Kofleriaceae bacterium]